VGKIVQLKLKDKHGLFTSLLVRHKGGNQFVPLSRGSPVYLGDELQTGHNTVVAIEFIIGGQVGINSDTQVTVNSERSVQDPPCSYRNNLFRTFEATYLQYNPPIYKVITGHDYKLPSCIPGYGGING